MASLVQMDTSLGFQTAEQFRQASDDVNTIINRIDAQVNQLDATWKGTSEVRFMSEYQAWKNDMLRFVQLLNDISTRVRKETQEIVDADTA